MPASLNERNNMATNTKTSKNKKTSTKSQTDEKQINETIDEIVEANLKEASTSNKSIIPKDIDASQYVTVRNGFQGKLIYRSRKTGEIFEWDEFGSGQEMELRELTSAKSSFKKFFVNNWFMFDEDWIIDYLGVRQYYKNAIPIDQFDNIFTQKPDILKNIISGLSDGQKKSVAYRAKELITDGKIDSLSIINTLEECLGIELIEK